MQANFFEKHMGHQNNTGPERLRLKHLISSISRVLQQPVANQHPASSHRAAEQ
jgi:hypothetical protein